MSEINDDLSILLDFYQDHTQLDKEFILVEFKERFDYARTMNIFFTSDNHCEHKKVHSRTIVLSELWYCFELFKPVITGYGFGVSKRSKFGTNKEWIDSQRVSLLGRIEAEKARKNSLYLNIDYSYNPSGYANLFNEKYLEGKWYEEFHQNVVDDFNLTSFEIDSVDTKMQRVLLSKYLDALASRAEGEQRVFLTRGFNALMKNSAKSLKSADILSFIYALRCNYVHAGELPESYQIPAAYKGEVIEQCVKFLTCYCCLLYIAITDELYQ